MISLGSMIKKLDALVDTMDLSDWENKFVSDIVAQTKLGEKTHFLTSKQVEVIERIYSKHYAD